jgi:hypothetical protein
MRFLNPKLMLHAEGAMLLAVAIVLYARTDASWWLFAPLFFAPDVAMLGYMAGSRVGAVAYNLAHTTALPLALGLVGVVTDADIVTYLALIWLAHIGFDRVLGYGLKYPEGFKETHLARV